MKVRYDYEDKKYDRDEYEKCDCYVEKKREKYDRRDYDDNKCCDEHKYAKCCPKSPCPYPILFECSCGTGATIRGTATAPTNFAKRSLGCVTIDTTCLKNPSVLFNFNTIITYHNTVDSSEPATLTFELCKVCDDGEEICCGSWDFEIDFAGAGEEITTSYTFSHCECNSCPGCCTYYVKLVNAVNVGLNNTLNLYNSTLSVFAKSSC